MLIKLLLYSRYLEYQTSEIHSYISVRSPDNRGNCGGMLAIVVCHHDAGKSKYKSELELAFPTRVPFNSYNNHFGGLNLKSYKVPQKIPTASLPGPRAAAAASRR